MKWVEGFQIRVRVQDGVPVISANREGMLSLANLLTAIAEEAPGSHMHLDGHNSLEDGSAELIIEKTE